MRRPGPAAPPSALSRRFSSMQGPVCPFILSGGAPGYYLPKGTEGQGRILQVGSWY